ncbi:MAG TPA: TIGR00730 family Rossman fold protein [Spirochaetales bacterium]|nr:TIGR00730 family Rossman fold protein [Spirochaetales bacterium]
MIRSICVFCGSAEGSSSRYGETAAAMGRLLAEKDYTLVYGGGNVGTMGIMAEAAMKAGGRVLGIIPKRLNGMVDHLELSELLVVEDMHERKALMQEKSEAFIALPGGLGTMEELFEVWTWRYIGYHAKPVGLLNCCGFYDKLLSFLETMRDEGFVKAEILEDLCVAKSPEALIQALEHKARAGEAPFIKTLERRR